MPQVIVNKQKWKEAIEDLEVSREFAKQAYCMEFMEKKRLLQKQLHCRGFATRLAAGVGIIPKQRPSKCTAEKERCIVSFHSVEEKPARHGSEKARIVLARC